MKISALPQDQLDTLPTKPGVYLMKDERGEIIYVGKAVNLRNRVRSYFHASAGHSPKVRRMVSHIADLEFIITDSELEALILECNLIKKHRPRYNVRLKDDKRYPYIKITWQEDYPRIYITRRMQRDGARYYGPFTASWAVHQTLELLRKIFPYITCKRQISGRDRRACLYYHIGRCAGPCVGAISKEEYRAMIERICLFLEGKTDEIVADLQTGMTAAAENLEFEQAARLRDQIQAVERVVEHQKIVSSTMEDQDVIALAREDGDACVQVFFIRRGKLLGREYFVLEGTADEEAEEIMASFLKQFYDEAAQVPPEILLPQDTEEAMIIQSWLKSKRGADVVLRVPGPGIGQDLVQMAAANAAETLTHLRAQWLTDETRSVEALTELQEHLGLGEAPTRIECYDVSNIQGTAATGSMAVFVKGVPRKSDYRRFKIRTVQSADDYAMLQEMLRRRFKRAGRNGMDIRDQGSNAQPSLPASLSPADKAWSILPDLIIVDGGKGQLNAALEVLEEYGLEEIPIAGLAKEREEIFAPGREEPITLPSGSQGLFLIQRIRDEAHRFAVEYHRKLRGKASLASVLEEVPGIGPKRQRALFKHFGSIEAIREATGEELAAVEGISREMAERLKDQL
ncbi:MAG: excinuclease ABC subunit UvrC [Anaerolineae bacterium]